jgi:RecB family endonuclease NucS
VAIELKNERFKPEHLGQLNFYLEALDRDIKKEHENPSIGILLCADKNDAVVRITLPENNKTIIASKYQLYLPTEQELMDEVRKEIERLYQKSNDE